MSLLSQAMTDVVMIRKTTRPDGYGGFTVQWTEDTTPFKAAITFDSSLQARVAEVQGVTSLYTIVTGREKVLMYHDVLKRLSDGKILRVTSDGDDRATPPEEWKLPN